MKLSQRRGFLCLAATTFTSLPLLDSSGLSLFLDENPPFSLMRSDVMKGLNQGLEFREQDLKVFSFFERFSNQQFMIGGGVLTFAAKQPTEWIHLLVRLDDLEAFAETMNDPDIPWGMGRSSHGNSLIFNYEEQLYYVETLMDEEFKERLAGLKVPGKEVNGFRVEFAHDAVLYDLQRRRYADPFDAIGRSDQIEMKRLVSPNGIPSAARILTEEKSLGLEVPRDEEEYAKDTIKGKNSESGDSKEDASQLLSALSRISENVPPEEVRELMTSDLAEESVEAELGEKVRRFATTFNSLDRTLNSELGTGALWHLSMKCLENTAHPECEIETALATLNLGGYDEYFARRDIAEAGRALSTIAQVQRLQQKRAAIEKMRQSMAPAPNRQTNGSSDDASGESPSSQPQSVPAERTPLPIPTASPPGGIIPSGRPVKPIENVTPVPVPIQKWKVRTTQ